MGDVWDLVPEALCVLGDGNKVVRANAKFQASIGSQQRLAELDFVQNIVGTEDRKRFLIALDRARGTATDAGESAAPSEGSSDMDVWLATPVVRDCDTLALGSSLDFPIWRRYDWAMSAGADGSIVVSGRMTTVVSEEKKASEKELMDFLNKAPIAMHWLSGTGHVLWANETEMNTLGYTAEEYIGQPIMKFCPDEEELVLEIFKTLGSGNTIKDVPVRFRTKDGQIRDLLIDSNVNWNADGSFKHTRCFIRDDTARKVREARADVLKEQDAQVAAAKDSFVRKIFHEIKTPCHIITNCFTELEDSVLKGEMLDNDSGSVLHDLKAQARRLTCLVDDAADAVIFDSGKVPKFKKKVFDLHQFIHSVVTEVEAVHQHHKKVDHYLTVGNNPSVFFHQSAEELKMCSLPKMVKGDAAYLRRAIVHVLENAFKFCYKGSITLAVDCSPGADENDDPLFFFTVTDTGPGMNTEQVNKAFNKYWQHVDTNNEGSSKNTSFDTSTGSFDAPTPSFSPLRGPSRQNSMGPIPSIHRDSGSGMTPILMPSSKSKNSSMETMETEFEKKKGKSYQQVEGLGLGLNIVNNIVQGMGGQLDFTSQPGETVFCISVCLATPSAKELASHKTSESSCSFSSFDFTKSLDLQSPMSQNQNPPNPNTPTIHSGGSGSPGSGPPKTFTARLAAYTMSSSEWVNVEDSQAAEKHFQVDSPILKAKRPIAVGLAQMTASQPHCLVVDDNSVCQKVAKRMVVKVGCTCDTAGNGQEAVDMVLANPTLYDIIFMDLRMPVMDGIDATTTIKQAGISVPIVAFSAEVGDETRQICEEVGFDGFMAKPAGRDIVEMHINKLVQNRICVDPPPVSV